MLDTIKSFLKDEEGATMIEYGLVVAGVATAAAAIFAEDGAVMNAVSDKVLSAISAAPGQIE